MNELFIAVAIDCDNADPEVRKMAAPHMGWARSLPFLIYVNADGEFLHGTEGGRSPAQLLADFERAVSPDGAGNSSNHR